MQQGCLCNNILIRYSAMIPKIIHQLWVGEKEAPSILMETWKNRHPDWQYTFWDEKKLIDEFPGGLENQQAFDVMAELNGKCDIARYEILYKYGGFFIDADSICIKKLTDTLLRNDSFSCFENEDVRGSLVAAGYLASTKQNLLMRHLIDEIKTLSINPAFLKNNRAWLTVGPWLLTTTICKHFYKKIRIYPSYYFIPVHYSGRTHPRAHEAFAHQFWGSTPDSPFNGYDFTKIELKNLLAK